MSSKRPRADSEASMPDLGPIEEASDDDAFDGLQPKKRDASFDFRDDDDNNSDSDEDFLPEEASLMADAGSVPIEPFHLRNEKEEGSVDVDGNFVQTREQIAESRDAWLDSIDESGRQSDLDKAKAAAEQREQFWKSVEAGTSGPMKATEDYLYLLIQRLLPRETPRAAMDRYLGRVSGGMGKPVFKSTIKAKRAAAQSEQNTAVVKDTASFEAVTELTDALTAKGVHDVLAEPRERLQARLNKLQFEYRWKSAQNDEIYGPFSFEALLNWDQQGCFKVNPIQVRYSGTSQSWRDFTGPH